MDINLPRFRFVSPLCSESEIDSINEEQNTDPEDGTYNGCEQNLTKRARNIYYLLAFKRKYLYKKCFIYE